MPSTNYYMELIVGIPVALFAIAFGFQSVIKSWKATATESSLLQMMHEELERMNQQNTNLSLEIGKLQQELVKLSKQLLTLTVENQKLQSEIASLNQEVSRLQDVLAGTTEND